jgi:DNA-directed RNA polymerase specialized sigma24 family protein
MRTATNLAFEHQKRKTIWKMEYKLPEQVCENTPYDCYCKNERDEIFSTRIMPAVRSLPSKQQEALYVLATAVSQKEASKMFGIPYSTLRARQKKSILNVRTKIKYLSAIRSLDP